MLRLPPTAAISHDYGRSRATKIQREVNVTINMHLYLVACLNVNEPCDWSMLGIRTTSYDVDGSKR